jgi:formylmethanofuran dehydrogenase subunit E
MNEALWAKCVAFHGHHCPGLAIGVRASLEAIKLLSIDTDQDEVCCISENSTCSVDGIRVLLGCTEEKGNLFFESNNLQAFSIFNKTTGESVRIVLKPLPQMSRDQLESFLLNEPDVSQIFVFEKTILKLPQ